MSEQLVNQINNLKVRLFDTEEAYRNLDKTLGEFAQQLAEALELDQEEAKDLGIYVAKVKEYVAKTKELQNEQKAD